MPVRAKCSALDLKPQQRHDSCNGPRIRVRCLHGTEKLSGLDLTSAGSCKPMLRIIVMLFLEVRLRKMSGWFSYNLELRFSRQTMKNKCLFGLS